MRCSGCESDLRFLVGCCWDMGIYMEDRFGDVKRRPHRFSPSNSGKTI